MRGLLLSPYIATRSRLANEPHREIYDEMTEEDFRKIFIIHGTSSVLSAEYPLNIVRGWTCHNLVVIEYTIKGIQRIDEILFGDQQT